MKHLLLLGLLLGGLAGCSKPEARVSAPPALTPAVQEMALNRGQAIAAETFGLLRTNLQTALQAGGISNALPFCSLAASPLTAGLAEKHGVTLKRISHKARNPANQASAVELAVLNRFAATLAATTNPPAPLATNLLPGQATFFAPIVLNHELCLQCHGTPGADLSPESLALIQRHYPQDQATGFQLGQLRGAWRIDFPLPAMNATNPPAIQTP